MTRFESRFDMILETLDHLKKDVLEMKAVMKEAVSSLEKNKGSVGAILEFLESLEDTERVLSGHRH